MSLSSGIGVLDSCIKMFNALTPDTSRLKYIIYKVSDDRKNVVIEYVGKFGTDGDKTDEDKTDEDKTDDDYTYKTKTDEGHIYKVKVYEDNISQEEIYEGLCEKLNMTHSITKKAVVRYATFEVKYDSDDGKRRKSLFIPFVPTTAPPLAKMLSSTTKETLKKSLSFQGTEIHADSLSDIEWKKVLKEVSGGKATELVA